MEKMLVHLRKGTAQVENLEQASKLIRTEIERKQVRSSVWYADKLVGTVMDNGEIVAHISYNGRIWNQKERP